jgi:hypothetical protein
MIFGGTFIGIFVIVLFPLGNRSIYSIMPLFAGPKQTVYSVDLVYHRVSKVTIIIALSIILVSSLFVIHKALNQDNFQKILSYPSNFIEFKNENLTFYYPQEWKPTENQVQMVEDDQNRNCLLQQINSEDLNILIIKSEVNSAGISCYSIYSKKFRDLAGEPNPINYNQNIGISLDNKKFNNYLSKDGIMFSSYLSKDNQNIFIIIHGPMKNFDNYRKMISTMIVK